MDKIWRDIIGFEGFYKVSSCGSIWSVRSDRELKKKINVTHGYIEVELNVNGKVSYKRVHRLVAESFIANTSNLPIVNHKDGDKQNNDMHNLEWCTGSDNNKHAIAMGLMATQNMKMKHVLTNGIDEFTIDSQHELTKITGYNKNTLTKYSKTGDQLRRGKYKGYTIKSHIA